MSGFIEYEGFSLEFLKEKALLIRELDSVLLADLHFGKASHFRKAGIPIPEPVHEADFQNLRKLLFRLNPKKIFFLGDLFHSSWNEQWDELDLFLRKFPDIEFHLIKGNHDILPSFYYRKTVLKIHEEPLILEPFVFSHEPQETQKNGLLNICGHIHPGLLLRGKARQSIKIPCFYWSDNKLILPSFGNFTGLSLIQPKETDRIWGISGEQVIPILSGESIG